MCVCVYARGCLRLALSCEFMSNTKFSFLEKQHTQMKSVCREMDRVEKREGERMKAKAKAQDKSREIERKRKSACE